MPKGNVNIRFDYDMKDFVKKANQVIKDVKSDSVETAKYCAQVFSNAAAKYTPPNIGKSSIEKQYYYRPFLVLIRLIRGGYGGLRATSEDIEQFKAGMVYKVLNTKGKLTFKSNVAFGYCKTKGQLKQMTRIETRGLSKVMWGKNLNEIGVKVPTTILRLMNKSPRLANINLNDVSLKSEDDKVTVEIVNNVDAIEEYARKAEAYGYDKVSSALAYRLRAIANRNREL